LIVFQRSRAFDANEAFLFVGFFMNLNFTFAIEVPCLGKNVMAASNAVSCANMALAGYDPVIPLDEVIHTMDAVGKRIPCELRCTSLGGLSMTETSKRIENILS